MQTAKGPPVAQAPSTSVTRDATDIPRQLESVNLDFSGKCLPTIILHVCCILWHSVRLLVAQPGAARICIQFPSALAAQALCLVQHCQSDTLLEDLAAAACSCHRWHHKWTQNCVGWPMGHSPAAQWPASIHTACVHSLSNSLPMRACKRLQMCATASTASRLGQQWTSSSMCLAAAAAGASWRSWGTAGQARPHW